MITISCMKKAIKHNTKEAIYENQLVVSRNFIYETRLKRTHMLARVIGREESQKTFSLFVGNNKNNTAAEKEISFFFNNLNETKYIQIPIVHNKIIEIR